MKYTGILAVLIFIAIVASGQGFNHALGLRGGFTSGVEYRYYTSDGHSLKGLLGTRDRGAQLYLLTEFYEYDLFLFSYQLVFYYGAGIHAGFESYDIFQQKENRLVEVTRSSFLAGLDGLIGLEYLFYEAPMTIGVEVKPFFDVFGRKRFDIQPFDFALTVKYLY